VDKRGWEQQQIHLAEDAHGTLVRSFIISGDTADCTAAAWLIEGFRAEYLPADHSYDTDAAVLKAADAGMPPVIPLKKNCKGLRDYDESP